MEQTVGVVSYLLLSLTLGLVAFQFLKAYGIALKSGSKATLGSILFSLFVALSAGMGLCAVWKVIPVEYGTLSRTATFTMFMLFFYAAITGIRLMRYMLPRTTLRVGIFFLPMILGAFWIVFSGMSAASPAHLHALASRAVFLLLASSLMSFLFVFAQFFLLSRNPEVKAKSLRIMTCAVFLLAGTFLGMVVSPLLGFSNLISALPVGFLGMAYIAITAIASLSALVYTANDKNAVNPSSPLADFLYSL